MGIGEKYFGELQCLSFEHGDHITILSLMMNMWSNLLLSSLSPIQINNLPAIKLGQRLTLSCQAAHNSKTGSAKTPKQDPKFQSNKTKKRGRK